MPGEPLVFAFHDDRLYTFERAERRSASVFGGPLQAKARIIKRADSTVIEDTEHVTWSTDPSGSPPPLLDGPPGWSRPPRQYAIRLPSGDQAGKPTCAPLQPRGLSDVYSNLLAPGYSVYDTWSFHYENNGVNEDTDELESGFWQREDGDAAGSPQIDEGTNGFDDPGVYWVTGTSAYVTERRHGPDDVGEYETTPPYDKPLRGLQVLIRTYEPDSRAIRQVRVNQHFLPE